MPRRTRQSGRAGERSGAEARSTGKSRRGGSHTEETSGYIEVSWEEIREPGTYVERESGHLFRIPREALGPRGGPLLIRESQRGARLVQISKNEAMTDREARLRCADLNIEPSF